MKTFSELALSPALNHNLARNGFVSPTPVQAQAIRPALAGRDVVATAQTGTGKTLAFVLPILESLILESSILKSNGKDPKNTGVEAVILSPTRELAIQIHEVFATLAAGTGITTATVVGGMNENTQLKAVRNGARVIIATPGRLCDFLNRKLVKLGGVRILVLDEADRMLDMGFLPAIRLILGALAPTRQNLFFSATIETSVAHLIDAYAKNPVRIAIGSATKPADSIDLHVYEVEQERKLGLLQFLLREQEGSFLVFARTKRGADRLSKKLSLGGVKTTAIHGDRTQNQRNQALKGFQQGDYRVLVATDVAARGIHVEGIAHVVNYDLPQAPEDLIHRAGRTGRAGAHGTASTFCTRSERSDVQTIERALKISLIRQTVPANIAVEVRPVIVMPVRQTTMSFQPRRRAGR